MAGLDGLRAVAVLAVIAYHLNLGWAPGGLLGVGVFFVLSGYLITDLLLARRERDGRIALGEFWRRRARRLLPALWVMLAAVVVWISVAQPSQLPRLRGDVGASFFYISNWWYVFQHVSYFASFGPPSPVGHLWSLAVEEQFYLVWPLLLLLGLHLMRRSGPSSPPLILRLRPRLLRPVGVASTVLVAALVSAILMAALYRPGSDPNRVYYGTDTRAFELLLGAALAFVWPSRRLLRQISMGRRITLEAAGTGGLVAIALLVALTDEYQPFLYRGGMVLLSLATVAAVAALVHPATIVGRVLGVAPLRWIGARSYGIYLWHYPVIVLTTPIVDTAGPHVLRGALQLSAVFVIAALSWRYVEQPIRIHGFGVVLAGLRTARWTYAGLPTGVYDAGAVGVLLVGASGAALALATAPVITPAQQAQLTASSQTTPVLPLSDPGGCIRPAPLPVSLPAPPPAAPAPPPSGADVTAIGDSIMIDVAPFLTDQLPGITVDGQVSRQMYELPSIFSELRAEGKLGKRLVLELGTNGPFDEAQLVSMLQSLGPMQRIVLVNSSEPRSWEADVNQSLADAAHHVPHTVIADWHGAAAGHPEYFWDDGVHPNQTGAPVMAGVIVRALGEPQPPPTPVVPRSAASIHIIRCAWW
jgi:peptidoglycan/LPS O-acetylase OafA/YrhL